MRIPDFEDTQELPVITVHPRIEPAEEGEAYAMAYEEIVDGTYDQKLFPDKNAALAFLEEKLSGHLPELTRAKIRGEINKEFFLREFL